MTRALSAENRCVPCLRPPTMKATPKTSRTLASIEPMSAACTNRHQPSS